MPVFQVISTICILPNRLVEGVLYVNYLKEYNVSKPVSNSYSSYLDSFASFFCGSARLWRVCLQKKRLALSG